MSKEFELPYYCSNGGDGSVTVRFCDSIEKAEKADEELDIGWGESSASSVKLKIEDGKLYYRDYQQKAELNERGYYDYEYVWIEVKND